MPESNIDLILRTKREGDAPSEAVQDLENMKTGLSDVEKAVAGTRTTIGGLDQDITLFGENIGSASDLLSGLGISIPVTPMQAFGQAIQAGAQFAQEAIGDYTEYVETISKLAAYTSTTTEEMSQMYQVADDLRIPVGSLEMALKTMAQNGTTPSIEGLMQLSDEYLAIQDPLQQAQFLTENFGRAGQEMARMMGLGSDAIDQQRQAISDWMLVTGESEGEVNEYLATMDRWDETIMEVEYAFAKALLPILTVVADILMTTQDEMEDNNMVWLRSIPVLGNLATAIWTVVEAIRALFGAEDEGAEKLTTAAATTVTTYTNATRRYDNRGNLIESRASGGEISPGPVYKVGEREVEYITSGANGYVTPASQAGSVVVQLTYSPLISTMDRAEAENILTPILRNALRRI